MFCSSSFPLRYLIKGMKVGVVRLGILVTLCICSQVVVTTNSDLFSPSKILRKWHVVVFPLVPVIPKVFLFLYWGYFIDDKVLNKLSNSSEFRTLLLSKLRLREVNINPAFFSIDSSTNLLHCSSLFVEINTISSVNSGYEG